MPMAGTIIPQRMTAEVDGDFVVFLIGMRINKPWKIHKWLPVFLAMPRMLKELEANRESGFLGHIMGVPVIVQYWRSFEHLESYARSQDRQHWPAWVAFNKRVGNSRGDVGIWHETYVVRAQQYECIYGNMPKMGLALAGSHVPAVGAYMLANYASYTAIVWLGQKFSAKSSWRKLVGGGLLGAVLFYLITNTLSWCQDPGYAKTLAGWIQALTTGLPGYPPTWTFFGNSMLSGGLFTGLFAAAMRLSEKMGAEEEEVVENEPDEQPEDAQTEESGA